MFCRYCGKELPDDAKFCNGCGKSVYEAATASQNQDATNENHTESGYQGTKSQEPVPTPEQSKFVAASPKAKRKFPLPAVLTIIIVAIVGIILIERYSGNQNLVNRTIESVSDQSESRIVKYYSDYFNINTSTGGYAVTTHYDRSDVTWDGNNVTIKWPLEIEILSGNRPSYTVEITLDAETNFWCSTLAYKNDWTYSFDVPDRSEINSALPEGEDIVSMKTLFEAFNNNAVTAINTYGGQYLNVSGIVGDMYTTAGGNTVVIFDYYYYNPDLGYSYDQMEASFTFADPTDPNLNTLEKDKVAIITGYMGTSYNGYSLELENCRVYGGEYSDNNYYNPDIEDNYSDSPEYDQYGNLTDNSPNLPVNLSEPFGYYEKSDGPGGFSIEYISDDDSVMIEYFSEGQPGYYGGQWFEADFHMSCDYIDFSSDNVLDFIDNQGNSIIRFDAYESYITITATNPLYGVSIDRINGNYYCKIQSSILQ